MSRKKSKTVKVTLRQRMLESGKVSLYLDYYPPIIDPETNRLTRRESLGMSVTPLKNRKGEYIKNKDENYKFSESDDETFRTAIIIRNNRQNTLDKANIYTDAEKDILKAKERSKGDFMDYFAKMAKDKETSNRSNWLSALAHLQNYLHYSDRASTIRFCDITLEWCEGFKSHLLTTDGRNYGKKLKINTASSYYVKFKVALKSAFKYGYLPKDMNADLKGIKEEETQREFLTLDELQLLAKTSCLDEVLKRAALFSALTGLRHSDIRKLKWCEVYEEKDNDKMRYKIKFTTQKTNKFIELPISDEAIQLCGERNSPERLVFEGLKPTQYGSKSLAQWIGVAGIERNITFHCFRHTYATLQLASGTQVTTIQKMLGHKNIGTTLIYAKTLEQAKQDATEKIKLKL